MAVGSGTSEGLAWTKGRWAYLKSPIASECDLTTGLPTYYYHLRGHVTGSDCSSTAQIDPFRTLRSQDYSSRVILGLHNPLRCDKAARH